MNKPQSIQLKNDLRDRNPIVQVIDSFKSETVNLKRTNAPEFQRVSFLWMDQQFKVLNP